MAPGKSTTRWRDEAFLPGDDDDVVKLVALAKKARDRVVVFDWAFAPEDLRDLRQAAFDWSSQVVGRYRCFDARVLAAINTALGEHKSIYVLREPKRARPMECAVSCTGDGDGFRLRGHAPFDVVFGYGHSGVTSIPATRSSGGSAFCATLVQAAEDLGWKPQRLLQPQLRPVLNVLYGFPVGHGVGPLHASSEPAQDVDVKFQGPFAVTTEDGVPSVFGGDLAGDTGIYLWTLLVGGKHRPWYVGQTRQGFGVRIGQHLAGCLSGQYEILDPKKLDEGALSVSWHPSAGEVAWPANLPSFLERSAELAPQVEGMLRHSRFFLAVLEEDQHLLNRVEGSIGRYFKKHQDDTTQRYFGPGIKLPAHIPGDRPLRLQITSDVTIEGMPVEIAE